MVIESESRILVDLLQELDTKLLKFMDRKLANEVANPYD